MKPIFQKAKQRIRRVGCRMRWTLLTNDSQWNAEAIFPPLEAFAISWFTVGLRFQRCRKWFLFIFPMKGKVCYQWYFSEHIHPMFLRSNFFVALFSRWDPIPGEEKQTWWEVILQLLWAVIDERMKCIN